MNLISLFTGAGGLDLGFHKAGSQMNLMQRYVPLSEKTFPMSV